MYLLGGITFFCAAPFYIWSWIDASVIGGIIPIPGRLQLKQAKVRCCLSLLQMALALTCLLCCCLQR